MKINAQPSGKYIIVRPVENRIDAANSPELKAYLMGVVESGQNVIGLDLAQVRFIDSSGLGVLVSVMKKIGQNGVMPLWGLSREVKGLFELTRLYEVFEIFEAESDAVERLKRHADG